MEQTERKEVRIYNAALELPAPERAAYLDQACSGDQALRRQVEALLHARMDADAFFKTAVDSQAGSSRPATVVLPITEKAGDRIGRYKLLQKIGEGGCGVVYMAEQEEPVRRRVALKVIKLGMDTKSVVARFEAERQALAMMDHLNIARVLDAGATEAGRPYFVMELVKGVRITDYCDQNHLPTQARLDLFIQVCSAIQHAHQKGVIHRDIKPSNILVTLHDGVPVPKVIDFGIAKATEARLTDKTLFTAFEQFIGTPAYMSPEQAEMSGLDIDTRSDIYSLGVLLYELLTGKTPFDARELWDAGLDAMRRTIREKEPVRPSTRLETMLEGELTTAAKQRQSEPPKLVNLVRGDLDWIVMKALEKDRTRRYESASSFAQDIQRHLSNEPVAARPPSLVYRLQKAVRRNKPAFVATAAVFVTLVIGLGLAAWQAVRASRAEHAAHRHAALARADRDRAVFAQSNATANAIEATNALQTAHERMVKLNVAEGWRRVEEGDYFGALLPFVAAWAMDGVNSTNAPLHRRRLGGLWQQCPRLANATALPTNLTYAAFSPNRTRFCTIESVGSTQSVIRVWDTATIRQLQRLAPTNDKVSTVTWSGDGHRLLTLHRGKSACVWDASTAQAVSPFIALSEETWQPALNFDGSRLAFKSGKTATLIDVATGALIWKYAPTNREVLDVGPPVFSPNGRTILTGSEVLNATSGLALPDEAGMTSDWYHKVTGVTNIENVSVSEDGSRMLMTGRFEEKQSRTWTTDERGLRSVTMYAETDGIGSTGGWLPPLSGTKVTQFSPDGGLIATADEEGTVWLWETDFGGVTAPPISHGAEVNLLVFSRNSQFLATGGGNRRGHSMVRVWDTASGQPVTPALPHRGTVLAAAFNDDCTRLLVVSDGTLAEWDLRTSGVSRFTWRMLGPALWMPLAISPDGKLLAANRADSFVQVWDLEDGALKQDFLEVHTWPSTLRFSPDGHRLHISDVWCTHVWDVASGKDELFSETDDNFTHISPKGDRILYRHPERTNIQVLEVATGKPIGELATERGWLHKAAFSPDGNSVVARAKNGVTLVWTLPNPRPALRLPPSEPNLPGQAADFHRTPDGRWLFWSREQGIDIWDPKTSERATVRYQWVVPTHMWSGDSVLSPDTDSVLSVNGSRAWVWSAKDGKQRTPFLEHRGDINSGAFSPDGKLVATGSADATVRLWDAATGEPVAHLRHSSKVAGVCFSPDGRGIATWDDQGLHFWAWAKDDRSLEDWTALAEFFGGDTSQREASSRAQPPRSVAEAWRTLQQKRPVDFTVSEAEADAWLRHQACRAGQRRDWANAVAHLTGLLERHPADADLLRRRGDAFLYWAEKSEGMDATNRLTAALTDYDAVLAWANARPAIAPTAREAVQEWRNDVLKGLGRAKEAQPR